MQGDFTVGLLIIYIYIHYWHQLYYRIMVVRMILPPIYFPPKFELLPLV